MAEKSRITGFTSGGVKYVPLAELFDRGDEEEERQYKLATRMARKGDLEGAIQPMGKGTPYAVPANWNPDELPEAGERRRGRNDGRERFTVYLTPSEWEAVQAALGIEWAGNDDNAITPDERRAKSKARREARKATKNE